MAIVRRADGSTIDTVTGEILQGPTGQTGNLLPPPEVLGSTLLPPQEFAQGVSGVRAQPTPTAQIIPQSTFIPNTVQDAADAANVSFFRDNNPGPIQAPPEIAPQGPIVVTGDQGAFDPVAHQRNIEAMARENAPPPPPVLAPAPTAPPPRPNALLDEPSTFQTRGELRNVAQDNLLSPFESDARQPFSDTTGRLTQSLEDQLGGLAFDPNTVRDNRTELIERAAQEERERLGRIFGIDPSQLQQGGAERGFSAVGAAQLNARNNLEAELQQQTFNNQLQRAGLTNQAVSGREGADLASRGLGLQATGQQLGFLGDRDRLALAEAELFGGSQGTTFNTQSFQAGMQSALNTSVGDPGYDPRFDLDNSGSIDFTDALQGVQQLQQGGGQFSTGGRQTLAALGQEGSLNNTSRALGIEEDRLAAGLQQFADTFDEDIRRFNSDFLNALQSGPDSVALGGPKGAQRRILDRQAEQLGEAMNINVRDLLRANGLNIGNLNTEEKLQLAALQTSIMFGPNVGFSGGFSAGGGGGGGGFLNTLISTAGQVAGSYLGRPG